jgi:DNA-binding winged helix-turn-helix (wHTH) protein/WD40 repeat protein
MPVEVETRVPGGSPFRVGDWLVEPSLNRLSMRDTTIQLELKVMDVLVCLAERAGEVVARQEIVDRVWATEFISDNTLTHAITEIRNALGDDARNPSFIETIHRRGYRLIAPVKLAVSDDAGEFKVARFPVPERPVGSADDRSPYPGLAAFTEADAEFFFGREDEVAQMWRRLTSRRLLAVIGPSGVGKSSFLCAGVIPAKPEGWGVLVCQPGEAPFAALARALVPEFGGDHDAISKLVHLSDPEETVAMVSRWRQQHEQALLIVDQFEELFTLNAPEVQARYSALLRLLVDQADIHLLLSMRDDFLYRCQSLEPLRLVLDGLFALEQPEARALECALIEPARRLGFTFEDNQLAAEMVGEVEGERGALPLLAFAVARLWDKRDREHNLLTRQAYEKIGGVGGALARHAEATLQAIGDERLPLVRELFRNFVTAEGTRAVREEEELLSVFPEPRREDASGVLRQLIDARLLTSFEEGTVEGRPGRHRIEVVHESLLTSWPRLVGWQTQDADSARIRDQLRQAARTWDEHDRTRDYLWSGRAYREFAVWRENYPGGLTELEEDFARAMTAHAKRRKRRRRIAAAAIFVVLLVGLTVVGSFWRQSVRQARRAEAAELLALAQVQLATDSTEAVAYATTSLELADTYESRIFAMRALWAGPALRAIDVAGTGPGGDYALPAFSPDGRWLAMAGINSEYVLVWNEGGGPPIVLGGHAVTPNGEVDCSWTREGLLVTGHYTEGRVRVWAMPEGRQVREIELAGKGFWTVGETDLFYKELVESRTTSGQQTYRLRSWRLPDGEPEELGEVSSPEELFASDPQGMFDPRPRRWIYQKGDRTFSRPLPIRADETGTLIAPAPKAWMHSFRTRPEGVFSSEVENGMILWTTAKGTSAPGRRLRTPETAPGRLSPEASGRWAIDGRFVDTGREGNKARLWDLEGLAGARPIELRRGGSWENSIHDFHPSGEWVVASTRGLSELSFWPLRNPLATVVDGYITYLSQAVGFTRDGRFLVTYWGQDRVRLWPLPGGDDADVLDLMLPPGTGPRGDFAVDPTGQHVLSLGFKGVSLLSLVGEDPLQLSGFPRSDYAWMGAFSPSGRLVAAATEFSEGQPTLRVWNLESGEVLVFDVPRRTMTSDVDGPLKGFVVSCLAFADETTLYTGGSNGLLRWNLDTGAYEQLFETEPGSILIMSMSVDRRKMLTYQTADYSARGQVFLHDLETGHVRRLEIPGNSTKLSLGPDGKTWVAGEDDGLIWVGRIDDGAAHVLVGHEGPVKSVAISPDRKWIASSGEDRTLRLWPMPDLSKPPLHALPRAELIAKLRSLTNLRVVRDPESSTGWALTHDPFPGWETVPSW